MLISSRQFKTHCYPFRIVELHDTAVTMVLTDRLIRACPWLRPVLSRMWPSDFYFCHCYRLCSPTKSGLEHLVKMSSERGAGSTGPQRSPRLAMLRPAIVGQSRFSLLRQGSLLCRRVAHKVTVVACYGIYRQIRSADPGVRLYFDRNVRRMSSCMHRNFEPTSNMPW